MSAWIFWLSIALVAYAYVGYPVLTRVLAGRFGSVPRLVDITPAVTVVIAAHNEAARIAGRIENILNQDYPIENLHILVVSDGSEDGTELAANIGPNTRTIALTQNRGKAVALNAALEAVSTEFVVFADVRQRFAPQTLRRLLAAFADPAVGAVSGELEIVETMTDQSRPANIGLYWRMEKSLRENESLLAWLHGVSGAVYALRKELFRPIRAGTILDDMWVPLHTVFAGRRVWMARDAIAYDTVSAQGGEEFRRKLRTLAGNWQLMARLPRVINPLRNPVFFAWFSHKFLRLIVPWALIAAWFASALAPDEIYRCAWLLQSGAYLVAILALLFPRAVCRVPLLPAAGTFLMLNAAALLALPAWLLLDPGRLWKKH